jgi:hypothetical protein
MNFAEFIKNLPGLNDLSIGERFLLSILVWHCGTNGHCWPTIDMLTKEMGGSRKTTFRLLNNLEAKGYVSRTKQDGNRNLYVVSSVKMTPCQNDTSVKKGSTQNDTQGCQKGDDSLKKKEKKERKVRTRLPLLKNVEDLEETLEKMDIEKCRAKWEPEGVDVDAVVRNMKKYVLTGDAKNPRPNPSNWRDFDRALDDSCERWKARYPNSRPVNQSANENLPESDHPLWPEIKALLKTDVVAWQELRHQAMPYARKKSQCGEQREPPEELTRQYMIKIYEAEKGTRDGI